MDDVTSKLKKLFKTKPKGFKGSGQKLGSNAQVCTQSLCEHASIAYLSSRNATCLCSRLHLLQFLLLQGLLNQQRGVYPSLHPHERNPLLLPANILLVCVQLQLQTGPMFLQPQC